MPREKSQPQRKKARTETAVPEEAALLQITPELIEQAEIGALRERIASGEIAALHPGRVGALPPEVEGLARVDVPADDFAALISLHDTICTRLDGRFAGWGGIGDRSGRTRGYGYLPGTRGAALYSGSEGHGFAMRELGGSAADEDRSANRRASVLLSGDDVPAATLAALDRLVAALRRVAPERYERFLKVEELIAAQPNLHNGRAYLRPHLDEPLHDGFGVVIVTVAVSGDATILMQPTPWVQGAAQRSFTLAAGQAYMLSAAARNTCLHGVLGDTGGRASLNLRFGLHPADPTEPFSAFEEVTRHWPDSEVEA